MLLIATKIFIIIHAVCIFKKNSVQVTYCNHIIIYSSTFVFLALLSSFWHSSIYRRIFCIVPFDLLWGSPTLPLTKDGGKLCIAGFTVKSGWVITHLSNNLVGLSHYLPKWEKRMEDCFISLATYLFLFKGEIKFTLRHLVVSVFNLCILVVVYNIYNAFK